MQRLLAWATAATMLSTTVTIGRTWAWRARRVGWAGTGARGTNDCSAALQLLRHSCCATEGTIQSRPAATSPHGLTTPNPPLPTAGPISAARLTPADTSGRLELLVDGVWGTACEGALGEAAAGVACRQMKLGNAGRTYAGGAETATLPVLPVLVTKLECMGTESTLQNCSVALGSTSCTNSEELQCYTGQPPNEQPEAGSAGAAAPRGPAFPGLVV